MLAGRGAASGAGRWLLAADGPHLFGLAIASKTAIFKGGFFLSFIFLSSIWNFCCHNSLSNSCDCLVEGGSEGHTLRATVCCCYRKLPNGI